MNKKTKNTLAILGTIMVLTPLCYMVVTNSGLNNLNNLKGTWSELGAPKHQTTLIDFDETSVYLNKKRVNTYQIDNTKELSFNYGNKKVECNLMSQSRLICKNLFHYKISFSR